MSAKKLENRLAALAKPLPGLPISGPSPLEMFYAGMSQGITPEESAEVEAKILERTSYPPITLEKAREIVAERRKAPVNILAGQRRSLSIIANNAATAARKRMNRLSAAPSAAVSAPLRRGAAAWPC